MGEGGQSGRRVETLQCQDMTTSEPGSLNLDPRSLGKILSAKEKKTWMQIN